MADFQTLESGKPKTVIIMAQGEAKRFPGKHSECIRGIPILKRTVEIVSDYINDIVVVAPDTDFFRSLNANLNCHVCTLANPGTGLLDGIFETRSIWINGALILLGDVVYSRELLHTMLTDVRSFVMYGRNHPNPYTGKEYAERYALRVGVQYGSYLYDRINWDRWRQHSNGRLAGLYHRIDQKCVWHEVEDWTDDVDTHEDLISLQAYCQHLENF